MATTYNGVQQAGGSGDDFLSGTGRNDLLLGAGGGDLIKGRNGHDDLFGGQGNDTLFGGNGQDRLSGDRGNNTLDGGNGDDTFVINAALVGGTQAFDTIVDFDIGRKLRDMTYDDAIEITNVAGKTVAFRENSDGSVTLLVNGAERAVFKGSEADPLKASDLLAVTEFVGVPTSVTLINAGGSPYNLSTAGTPQDDVISGNPYVGNTIAGNDGADILNGQGKDDFLLGNKGNDVLNGNGGNDTLKGGGDNDTLNGGDGNDSLSGDLGTDTFVFDNNDGTDTVSGYVTGEIIELTSDGTYTLTDTGSDIVLTYGSTVVTFVGVANDVDLTITV